MKVKTQGKTVRERQAEKFLALVEKGATSEAAAEEVGVSLSILRKQGEVAKIAAELINRIESAGLLNPEARKKLVKARLIELMMQDDDKRIALGASRAVQNELGIGNPAIALQINNVVRDEKVIKALQSLQIDVEGEVIDAEDIGREQLRELESSHADRGPRSTGAAESGRDNDSD